MEIPRFIFAQTLAELRDRSAGTRESAAIWSGGVGGNRTVVTRVDFHHGLCDDRATSASLELSEDAKLDLYQKLAGLRLRLAALVHTHPQDWVGLSPVDRSNQVCSRVGFWSLVIPNYGREPWRIEEIGIHIQTEKGWHQLSSEDACEMISVVD